MTKNYNDFEEICYDMHRLMIWSKYNMKKSNLKTIANSITFVCSCISRKKGKISTEQSNFINDSFDSNVESMPSMTKTSKREIKRSNRDACHFRIKFKLEKNKNSIKFLKQSYQPHNHTPNAKLAKVSKIFYINPLTFLPIFISITNTLFINLLT